jgi:hypothetical protein
MTDRYPSREQSQAVFFPLPETAMIDPMPFPLNEIKEPGNFNFNYECAVYRKIKSNLLPEGWEEVEIFGRNGVDVDTLLFDFSDPDHSQPVSMWASKMVNKMLPTASLPVRLASCFLLNKMLRVCKSDQDGQT